MPVSFFFEGLPAAVPTMTVVTDESSRPASAVGAPLRTGASDLMGDREAMDLVRTYYAIPENQRRRLFDLARVLSDVA